MSIAETIVINMMYKNDEYSKWLGIKILEVAEGYCKIQMDVRDEMTNGFKICHGGITYSFADSALAFASNTFNKMAVSIETSISHIKPAYVNDILMATTSLKAKTNKTAIYEVNITNQKEELIALFKGTVYIKDKNWIEE
jgi:acyl-CoA thioesterase